ncbi:hypothetical protein HK102_002334, partial [Quaeritorhiza haematococci]
MALKAELVTWQEGVEAYDDGDWDDALAIFESIADTAKIHFNIAMTFLNLGLVEDAIGALTRAISCDPYLAIAYHQRGACFYRTGEFGEALQDFNDALTNMRGNLLIDYTQIGLNIKLYACEVAFNRGLCFLQLQQIEAGLAEIEDAARTRPNDKAAGDMARISEALEFGEAAPNYVEPFSVPSNVIYRPPESKIKNSKKVDYLGKSKVVAAVDEKDTYTGFSGKQLKQATLSRKKKEDPPKEIDMKFVPAATLEKAPTLSRAKTLNPRGVDSPTPYSTGTIGRRTPTTLNRSGSLSGASTLSRSNTTASPLGRSPGPGMTGSGVSIPQRSRSSSLSGGPGEDATSYFERTRTVGAGSTGDRTPPGSPGGGHYRRPSNPESSLRKNVLNGSVREMDRSDAGSIRSFSQLSIGAGDKIKIKCHFSDTRIILVPSDVTFEELSSRIHKKFDVPGKLKLKYKDEDG